MYLTADLVYSDPAGTITASTLLDMFSAWMLSQDNPSVLVNGRNLSLITKCPVEMNAITKDVCAAFISDGSADSITQITGVFFGGLVAGASMIIIAFGIIFW